MFSQSFIDDLDPSSFDHALYKGRATNSKNPGKERGQP